jgi:hypothetical protein
MMEQSDPFELRKTYNTYCREYRLLHKAGGFDAVYHSHQMEINRYEHLLSTTYGTYDQRSLLYQTMRMIRAAFRAYRNLHMSFPYVGADDRPFRERYHLVNLFNELAGKSYYLSRVGNMETITNILNQRRNVRIQMVVFPGRLSKIVKGRL